MDYDDDGTLDFISGSYDPGDLYLFRGLGGGKYAQGEQILDKSGQPVVHHPKEFAKYMKLKDDPDADEDETIMARVASFGSWVAAVDWEQDGDLDLLIGSFGGQMFRRMNEGTRSKPIYGLESIPVEVNGAPLKVSGHANPVVADWNADGKWDLVVSASDGSVRWYENIGTSTRPEFGPGRELVAAAAENKFLEQELKPGQDPVPGVRAQICVTDYNHDGRLDLVLGDYSDINWTRELTEDEVDAMQKTDTELEEVIARIRQLQANQSTDSPEYRATVNQYQSLTEKRKTFYKESRRASFIWLYLRRGDAPEGDKLGGPGEQDTAAPAAAETGPVSIRAKLDRIEGRSSTQYRLSVHLDIQPGWHLYATGPTDGRGLATQLRLQLPAGVKAVGDWMSPAAVPDKNDIDSLIYEGTVVFRHLLNVDATSRPAEIGVEVKYQVCDDRRCLPPQTVNRSVAIRKPG